MSRSGSPYSVPRDANRVPFLVAASVADGVTPVTLEADPVTHQLQVSSSGGGGGSTTNANIYTGQQTSNTSAVQLTASSQTLTNGVILQALSTNTASIFVGANGVGVGTGFELQAGQATSVAANNMNLVYVIGSNNTDKICWIGN